MKHVILTVILIVYLFAAQGCASNPYIYTKEEQEKQLAAYEQWQKELEAERRKKESQPILESQPVLALKKDYKDIPILHDRDWYRIVQIELRDQGYDPGPIDGVLGPQTIAALKALKKDNRKLTLNINRILEELGAACYFRLSVSEGYLEVVCKDDCLPTDPVEVGKYYETTVTCEGERPFNARITKDHLEYETIPKVEITCPKGIIITNDGVQGCAK